MIKDDLGTRMKEYYEQIPKTRLMRRTPVAMRIDGKAFHTFTRGFKKPFDYILVETMQETMKALCENIQGCVLGYTQSDEITLILCDYQTLTTSAWFDYEVQKMCSVGASMATLYFNQIFAKKVNDFLFECVDDEDEEMLTYINTLVNAREKGAMFDARVFNIPREEVTNLVYWRQQDASKNSIQMVARSLFHHNQLIGKSSNDLQEMMFQVHRVNWNDLPTHLKRGSCCVRRVNPDNPTRKMWCIDTEIPRFVDEGRNYIENEINF